MTRAGGPKRNPYKIKAERRMQCDEGDEGRVHKSCESRKHEMNSTNNGEAKKPQS